MKKYLLAGFGIVIAVIAVLVIFSFTASPPGAGNNSTSWTEEIKDNESNETIIKINETVVKMCTEDADCALSNYMINKCIAAEAGAYCTHEGFIACNSAKDCRPPEGYYSMCAYLGTLNATCFHMPEGVLPSEHENCKSDSDCDDHKTETYDTCAYVNENFSFCAYIENEEE